MANKTGYIDIHHHIIPEFYLDALKEAGIDKAGGLKINNWQPENSIKMMDRLGIEVGITSISDPVVEPLEPSKRKAIAREINLLQNKSSKSIQIVLVLSQHCHYLMWIVQLKKLNMLWIIYNWMV